MFRRKKLSERELVERAGDELRRHGLNAPLHSAMRADRCEKEGRLDEAQTWRAVSGKLRTLLAETA